MRGVEVYLYSIFNLGDRWWWVVNARPLSPYSCELPGIRSIGGWLGLRTSLDGCGKSHPTLGFDLRLVGNKYGTL